MRKIFNFINKKYFLFLLYFHQCLYSTSQSDCLLIWHQTWFNCSGSDSKLHESEFNVCFHCRDVAVPSARCNKVMNIKQNSSCIFRDVTPKITVFPSVWQRMPLSTQHNLIDICHTYLDQLTKFNITLILCFCSFRHLTKLT